MCFSGFSETLGRPTQFIQPRQSDVSGDTFKSGEDPRLLVRFSFDICSSRSLHQSVVQSSLFSCRANKNLLLFLLLAFSLKYGRHRGGVEAAASGEASAGRAGGGEGTRTHRGGGEEEEGRRVGGGDEEVIRHQIPAPPSEHQALGTGGREGHRYIQTDFRITCVWGGSELQTVGVGGSCDTKPLHS